MPDVVDAPTVPLMASVTRLVDGIPGWTPIDELYTLALLALMTSNLDGDVVELGSWCGRSTVALASTMAEGEGCVHSVDLFPEATDWYRNADGSYSFDTTLGTTTYRGNTSDPVWAEPFERDIAPVYRRSPHLLEQFRATLATRGLTSRVRVHRGTAASFAAALPRGFRCRLLFIDGDHSFEAVSHDIDCLEPFLVPGGVLCLDDAFSAYAGVDRAIAERLLTRDDYDVLQQATRKLFVARKRPDAGR